MNARHIIIVSHRRSGTHLSIDAIANNFEGFFEARNHGEINLDHLLSRSRKTVTLSEIRARLPAGPCVFKTHSHADWSRFFRESREALDFVNELAANAVIINICREGKDVLTSLYHYMHKYDSGIKEKSFSEFLRMVNGFDADTYDGNLDRVEYWAFHIKSWQQENVYRVRYEDLIRDYARTLERMSADLGFPMKKKVLDVRRGQAGGFRKWLSKLAHPGIRHTSVHFRRGKTGDWREHFSAGDEAYFQEKAGAVNGKAGYL